MPPLNQKDKLCFPFGFGAVLAEQRLFCLPFAGGGASFFLPWRKILTEVAVIPLQYPGRETRISESCHDELSHLVEELAIALLPHLDRPYTLLGYSLGAKVGFALCHRLIELGAPPPRLFIAIAHGAPDAEPFLRGAADLPPESFEQHIKRYGGMPDVVFQDAELAKMLLSVLRSDIRLVEHAVPDQPLPCNIVAYAGAEDHAAPPESLEEWRRFSATGFTRRTFAGGHFFARSASDFLPTLAADLATDLATNLAAG
jgi:surfactin synthase thioesterase subunit